MNPRNPALRIAALAAVAVLVFSLREVFFRDRLASAPPARSAAKTDSPSSSAAVPAPRPSASAPAQDSGLADFPGASFEALTSLVSARLREWEADDLPELRDARTRELEAAFNRAGKTIEERLRVIAALPENLRDFAFGQPSFQQWMFSHPTAALEWMSSHPEISEARVLALFQDWGEKNRQEFQSYLTGLGDGPWKQKTFTAATHEALHEHSIEAINYARQLEPGGMRTSLLANATAEWARNDPAAAARWVAQVSEPEVREQLTGALVTTYAEIAPAAAAVWAFDDLPAGRTRDRALAEIAGAWAKQDPASVAAWIVRFPPGEARQMALGNLLNAWVNRDRAAARTWVQSLSDETFRAQAAEFAALDLSESSVLP